MSSSQSGWPAWLRWKKKRAQRWRFQKDTLGEYELRLKLLQYQKDWKRGFKSNALVKQINKTLKRDATDDDTDEILREYKALDYDAEDDDQTPYLWRHRVLNATSSRPVAFLRNMFGFERGVNFDTVVVEVIAQLLDRKQDAARQLYSISNKSTVVEFYLPQLWSD